MTNNAVARQEYGWAGTVQQFLKTSLQASIGELIQHEAAPYQRYPGVTQQAV